MSAYNYNGQKNSLEAFVIVYEIYSVAKYSTLG